MADSQSGGPKASSNSTLYIIVAVLILVVLAIGWLIYGRGSHEIPSDMSTTEESSAPAADSGTTSESSTTEPATTEPAMEPQPDTNTMQSAPDDTTTEPATDTTQPAPDDTTQSEPESQSTQ
jgi:cytoskeletal protein RodZ